jgi:hypothetical protein
MSISVVFCCTVFIVCLKTVCNTLAAVRSWHKKSILVKNFGYAGDAWKSFTSLAYCCAMSQNVLFHRLSKKGIVIDEILSW